MKKTTILCTILTTIALLWSGFAMAGNRPNATTLTLGAGAYRFAMKRHIDSTTVPNVALAYNFDEHWAAEADLGIVNTNQQRYAKHGVHGYLGTVDGLYRFTPRGTFEPYVSFGVGMLGLYPSGLDSEYQGNLNAGIGTQWFVDRSVALRAEARDLYTIIGGKNDLMLNFGVSFLMGG